MFLILAAACVGRAQRETSFDAGWLFRRGECPGSTVPIPPPRHQPPSPPPPPAVYPCRLRGYRAEGWRKLSVPHDWSREDLPPRDLDPEYPVLEVRYGAWKLKAGDDASWAAVDFDDSGWIQAKGTPMLPACAPRAPPGGRWRSVAPRCMLMCGS